MRSYARWYGAVSSDAGVGIISSSAGTPILPSGIPPGEQPATGTPTAVWTEVSTDAQGNNDLVYFVTLAQCLQLSLNEDPSYSQFGIPATQSVQTGVPPDFYVARMQAAFAPYFVSLTVVRAKDANGDPAYNISCLFHSGVELNASVPIPY